MSDSALSHGGSRSRSRRRRSRHLLADWGTHLKHRHNRATARRVYSYGRNIEPGLCRPWRLRSRWRRVAVRKRRLEEDMKGSALYGVSCQDSEAPGEERRAQQGASSSRIADVLVPVRPHASAKNGPHEESDDGWNEYELRHRARRIPLCSAVRGVVSARIENPVGDDRTRVQTNSGSFSRDGGVGRAAAADARAHALARAHASPAAPATRAAVPPAVGGAGVPVTRARRRCWRAVRPSFPSLPTTLFPFLPLLTLALQ